MLLSDLQNKDIVNMHDGKKIGNIIDARFNIVNGNIEKLIIEPSKSFFSIKNNSIEISFNQINSIANLSCLNQLELKKIEVKENPFTKNDSEYRDKIYKIIPSLIIVDQMQKNGQEIDTSDYGNESSSYDEEEDDDNDEEESDESDGKDVDSKESLDDYNEENEDDEGGKKKRKNK